MYTLLWEGVRLRMKGNESVLLVFLQLAKVWRASSSIVWGLFLSFFIQSEWDFADGAPQKLKQMAFSSLK